MSQVKTKPRDASRDALREAIDKRHAAFKAVDAARVAEHAARECTYKAQHVVDELRAKAEEPRSADDVVAAITSGVDADILELQHPAEDIAKEIEAADEKVRAWRNAADGAEQAIPVREAACARAEVDVKNAANVVITGSLDIDKLLEGARIGSDWLRDRRAVLLHLSSILERESPDRAAINDFLAIPFLFGEVDPNQSWRRNGAVKVFADAHAALCRDAEAPITLEITP
jgi:hypothetical protein